MLYDFKEVANAQNIQYELRNVNKFKHQLPKVEPIKEALLG